uniref:NADH-ubiquinone oxidoreductase chain 3 n=3 Tax=Anisakis simplex complex TaxID=644710 RepID=Q1X6K5_ANISI|nr:NADH dehydrogenase subunit 3 [Anisakis berlandi]YP_009355298.1 NADH dehydrogenase subunit 3 [Anisakis pegreffii]YP_537098.1 NADH dehydrogenase subunit 3 [Anisakis simplex]AAY43172.1 NADH dehydrogenase subunit 3 [Anisakis simplex]AES86027.1 NADH dehydrogenase subunit 3 [Anisakis berlandi]AES86039.1 NADH dehydrogenase subunit 3 [Anisakis simplex]AES86051.1 NADH dehydrogenase subunit 3 [Anisakis simplex]AES86063.1 NADH dehydrogenase subunit 3 [Anisakis simplex]
MMVLVMVIIFTLLLLLLFYLGNFVLSCKDFYKNKISSFECGFDSVGKIQNSFSIHFFIMMLMFVIFDLEVVMFVGILISDISSLLSFLMLLFFILGGFYMEWWYGKLIWLI